MFYLDVNHRYNLNKYLQNNIEYYNNCINLEMVCQIINILISSFRFRVYFQEIICCCCFRFWKSRHKNDQPKNGILLNKNSNSEMGRTRSCKLLIKTNSDNNLIII